MKNEERLDAAAHGGCEVKNEEKEIALMFGEALSRRQELLQEYVLMFQVPGLLVFYSPDVCFLF